MGFRRVICIRKCVCCSGGLASASSPERWYSEPFLVPSSPDMSCSGLASAWSERPVQVALFEVSRIQTARPDGATCGGGRA